MKKFKKIALRMFAVIIAQTMGMLGAGSVLGIEVWQAAAMAAVGGIATVSEALARAYLKDGDLTIAEIDEAFSKIKAKGGK
jgi:hypothetical protein